MQVLLAKPLDENEYPANIDFNRRYSVGQVFNMRCYPEDTNKYLVTKAFSDTGRFFLDPKELSCFKEIPDESTTD